MVESPAGCEGGGVLEPCDLVPAECGRDLLDPFDEELNFEAASVDGEAILVDGGLKKEDRPTRAEEFAEDAEAIGTILGGTDLPEDINAEGESGVNFCPEPGLLLCCSGKMDR